MLFLQIVFLSQFKNIYEDMSDFQIQATNCGDMIDAPKWATSVFPWQVEQSLKDAICTKIWCSCQRPAICGQV